MHCHKISGHIGSLFEDHRYKVQQNEIKDFRILLASPFSANPISAPPPPPTKKKKKKKKEKFYSYFSFYAREKNFKEFF